MIIRLFEPEDATQLGRLFYRSVREIGGAHYSAAQVSAWAPAEPGGESYVARAKDGRVFLVAVADAGALLAYGDLEQDGHINHLYCAPEAAGTGVAAQLYQDLETIASERGLNLLYVEASEPAKRFFIRRGFTVVQRRDFILRGVPIHNYRMEKLLGAAAPLDQG